MPSPLAFFIFRQRATPFPTSREEMGKPAIAFLKAFTGEWYTNSWKRWCIVDEIDSSQHIQLHLRYLSLRCSQERGVTAQTGPIGLAISREVYGVRRRADASSDGDLMRFAENRVTLSICMSTISKSPYDSLSAGITAACNAKKIFPVLILPILIRESRQLALSTIYSKTTTLLS